MHLCQQKNKTKEINIFCYLFCFRSNHRLPIDFASAAQTRVATAREKSTSPNRTCAATRAETNAQNRQCKSDCRCRNGLPDQMADARWARVCIDQSIAPSTSRKMLLKLDLQSVKNKYDKNLTRSEFFLWIVRPPSLDPKQRVFSEIGNSETAVIRNPA